jgi:hypothetical protein
MERHESVRNMTSRKGAAAQSAASPEGLRDPPDKSWREPETRDRSTRLRADANSREATLRERTRLAQPRLGFLHTSQQWGSALVRVRRLQSISPRSGREVSRETYMISRRRPVKARTPAGAMERVVCVSVGGTSSVYERCGPLAQVMPARLTGGDPHTGTKSRSPGHTGTHLFRAGLATGSAARFL